MATRQTKKLCWNCEGRVSFQEENCPFCGVYLSPSTSSEEEDHPADSLRPPYQMAGEDDDEEVQHAPYQSVSAAQDHSSTATHERLPVSNSMKATMTSLSTLLSGSIFFLFGLVLLLFSHNGTLTLQWDASSWYLYLFGGLVLLLWGWSSLHNIEDSSR